MTDLPLIRNRQDEMSSGTVTGTSRRDPRAWLTLELRLGGDGRDGGRLMPWSNGAAVEVEPLDEASRGYDARNWEGGVLSGVRFGGRDASGRRVPIVFDGLRGSLGSGDMDAVAYAAAALCRALRGAEPLPLEADGWEFGLKLP